MNSSYVSLINLSDTILQGAFISRELFTSIEEVIFSKKKVLLLYNKRWYGRLFSCNDCAYYWKCPFCDVAYSYHTHPKKTLICHQCNNTIDLPISCPECSSHNIVSKWIGIQQIFTDLVRLFPTANIIRLDSDIKKEWGNLYWWIESADIIIGTDMANSIHNNNIVLTSFLLLESEFTIPDYRIEEKIYLQITSALKYGSHVLIQTYLKDSSFIDICLEWNYKSFFQYCLQMRKKYWYPPYGNLIHLFVQDKSQWIVKDIIWKLSNKIQSLQQEMQLNDFSFFYDRDIWDKRANDWIQKIVLKWTDAEIILSLLQIEILRNRQVHIERR